MNARRRVLAGFSMVALSIVLPCFAQQPGKIRRIGFFYFGSRQSAMDSGRYDAFLRGMRELGYVEGKNFVIEARFADGKDERLPGLAAELVRSKVDVIVATGTAVYAALKQPANTIPVVITATSDPVVEGFAANLARPGGNFTGLSAGNFELYPKQIELLSLAVPKLSHVAVLWNSTHPGHPARLNAMQAVARKAGIRTLHVGARSADEIERGFTLMSRERVKALIVLNDTFFVQQFRQIATLALKHRLPSLYGAVEYPESGGLMGYGQNILDNFRSAATFVDKILKGAKPGELPFEQPMRLQLVINRKTANAIGLVIEPELLLRADRVIE
jgi:putative ABC transport system substrate-binding protein